MFTFVIVVTSIGSLHVTRTVVLVGTPVARFAGCTLETCGGTTSIVVNVHVFAAPIGLPEASRAPVVTVAVYDVPPVSGADGVNVALFVPAVYVTVPVRFA